ncbi:unnamed protein product [Rotaria magnacalcarata]|uniref:FLYWCH-type domain-containing protein n=2 Tax=Rotaria magnacalcarata TaxID=392030 RepID=A0A816F1Y6_9BILA|nr:unnamed protein product [Rotaria magnacalcarata]CAF1653902.1 unnamed protein product [Rotaria magnacalcarata]
METDVNSLHLKEYSLVETKRHKPCLIYCGHRYVQDKIQNRTIYWRCEDRSHCNGRAHQLIGNGSLPILTIKHNHPPIIEDLSRHDIVSVDSHRRQKRQNRKVCSYHLQQKNDLLFSTTSSIMTSAIKLENYQNKQQRLQQQQHATMAKNLHLSEVITTAQPANIRNCNSINAYLHTMPDPNEMTKLLSNITTTSTNYSLKKTSTSPTIDYPSRLNHFSWEEIEGRYLPVIYRHEHGINQRYISKIYVERTLFESESWQRHTLLARSLPPLVSYSYTENELKLFRSIIEWHLASLHFKTIPSSDCLICFEDLLDFYSNLRKLRDNIPTAVTTTTTTFNRPIAPLPRPSPLPLKPTIVPSQSFELPTQIISSVKEQPKSHLLPQNADISMQMNRGQTQIVTTQKNSKESGWVQINNVFIPYIVKTKLRENELNKCHTRQPAPQLQREFYVPYEILIKCNIFSDSEFSLRKLLIKATQQDFDILNNLITNINIFDEKVPEKTLLVNLYHVMVGLNRIFYIKFLPTKQPRTQVNKYHIEILTHTGGSLLMSGNKLIPYIVQNSRFYVPLLYTFHSLPNVLLQAKRSARAPRQHEIDYLNLLLIYFSIDTQPLTLDTLLVDIYNIKCSNLQTPIHYRTLYEHQQHEKNKLLNSIIRCSQPQKTTNGSSSTSSSSASASASSNKTNKYPLTNVVVNPMIHHPSFYGLITPKPVLSVPKIVKQPEIKTVIYENRVLNAIVKSSDISVADWKISLKEIFQKFSIHIDYQKFIQWCQANLLLPLIKMDEQEHQIIKNTQNDDAYYVYQRNLDRCVELLNDITRGSISMTLLSTASSTISTLDYESQQQQQQQSMIQSPLAGAKKRKTTVPTTRHISPSPTAIKEMNPLASSIPQEIEHSSSAVPVPEEITLSVTNEISVKSPNDQITCQIVSVDDDDGTMPVVASVEEEQPLEDSDQSEPDTSFVFVDSTDCNDEKIQLDDRILSCSSGYESSATLTNIDINVHEGEEETNSTINSRENSSSCISAISQESFMVSSKNQYKINRKRQRNNHGGSRSRSLTSRSVKKQCSMNEHSPLVSIITKDKIEQHLKTLFMSSNEKKRPRTRPIKTSTTNHTIEKVNTNNDNSVKMIEQDTNVFDILSSSITGESIIPDDDPTQSQSCTYNVVITDKPNKLGLTIKKVAQS